MRMSKILGLKIIHNTNNLTKKDLQNISEYLINYSVLVEDYKFEQQMNSNLRRQQDLLLTEIEKADNIIDLLLDKYVDNEVNQLQCTICHIKEGYRDCNVPCPNRNQQKTWLYQHIDELIGEDDEGDTE